MSIDQREDFLFEIGTEELPAGIQSTLIIELEGRFKQVLAEYALQYEKIHSYVTPRRLAISIEQLQTETLSISTGRLGPLLSLAIDSQGLPTAAGLGFAKSCGVDFASLKHKDTAKGACLYYHCEEPAQKTAELLPAWCKKIVSTLPIPKPMRWGNCSKSFARPVHWLVLLFGREVLPLKLFEQVSDRLTYGHRFHHPQAIRIDEAKQYEELLDKAYVVADAGKRRALILKGIEDKSSEANGIMTVNEELLTEVTSIVEWPVPLLGKFDPHFLSVPQEALILAMQHHQKTFYVHDKAGKLLPYFVSVSNIDSRDPKQVILGNERVINARLADAKFFFDTDRKHSLSFMAQHLKDVIFYARLGSLQDKSERIAKLAKEIAALLHLDTEAAHRAGLLCKADLVSDMVGEFPELQGIMGGYYATHSQESSQVAMAIREHYQPRFAKDALPQSDLGAVVAIADKLDTLVGIFAIGEVPKGDKDPFALRRSALGVLKIIVEKAWSLDLWALLQYAQSVYGSMATEATLTTQVFDFLMERFKYYYLEQGISAEVFMAVLATKPHEPYDFSHRLQAVEAFRQLPQCTALAAANKRVSRILEKEARDLHDMKVDASLLTEPAEKALWQALEEQKKIVSPLYEKRDYTQALTSLAKLQTTVDAFFDNTMVMVEDKAIRQNRLALLQQLQAIFSVAADLSCL